VRQGASTRRRSTGCRPAQRTQAARHPTGTAFLGPWGKRWTAACSTRSATTPCHAGSFPASGRGRRVQRCLLARVPALSVLAEDHSSAAAMPQRKQFQATGAAKCRALRMSTAPLRVHARAIGSVACHHDPHGSRGRAAPANLHSDVALCCGGEHWLCKGNFMMPAGPPAAK